MAREDLSVENIGPNLFSTKPGLTYFLEEIQTPIFIIHLPGSYCTHVTCQYSLLPLTLCRPSAAGPKEAALTHLSPQIPRQSKEDIRKKREETGRST